MIIWAFMMFIPIKPNYKILFQLYFDFFIDLTGNTPRLWQQLWHPFSVSAGFEEIGL
jgi:hypothetical protein